MISLTLINTLIRFLIYEKRNTNAVNRIKNGGFWNGLKQKNEKIIFSGTSNLSFSAKKDTRYCIRFALITLYLVSFAFY